MPTAGTGGLPSMHSTAPRSARDGAHAAVRTRRQRSLRAPSPAHLGVLLPDAGQELAALHHILRRPAVGQAHKVHLKLTVDVGRGGEFVDKGGAAAAETKSSSSSCGGGGAAAAAAAAHRQRRRRCSGGGGSSSTAAAAAARAACQAHTHLHRGGHGLLVKVGEHGQVVLQVAQGICRQAGERRERGSRGGGGEAVFRQGIPGRVEVEARQAGALHAEAQPGRSEQIDQLAQSPPERSVWKTISRPSRMASELALHTTSLPFTASTWRRAGQAWEHTGGMSTAGAW